MLAIAQDDVAVAIVMFFVMGGVAITLGVNQSRHKQRMQRLKVLESALQRPDLDPATRDQVLRVLTEERDGGLPTLLRDFLRPERWTRALFGVGWFLFVVGAGAAIADMFNIMDADPDFTVPSALVGLAMMTLPLGMRELARREHAVLDRK